MVVPLPPEGRACRRGSAASQRYHRPDAFQSPLESAGSARDCKNVLHKTKELERWRCLATLPRPDINSSSLGGRGLRPRVQHPCFKCVLETVAMPSNASPSVRSYYFTGGNSQPFWQWDTEWRRLYCPAQRARRLFRKKSTANSEPTCLPLSADPPSADRLLLPAVTATTDDIVEDANAAAVAGIAESSD